MEKKVIKCLLSLIIVLLSGYYGLLRAHTYADSGIYSEIKSQGTQLVEFSKKSHSDNVLVFSRKETNHLKLDDAEITEQQARSLSSKEWFDRNSGLAMFFENGRLFNKVFSRLSFHRRHIIFQMFRV